MHLKQIQLNPGHNKIYLLVVFQNQHYPPSRQMLNIYDKETLLHVSLLLSICTIAHDLKT
jgi:hypothetical protein